MLCPDPPWTLDRAGAMTISLRSLFQWQTILSVKNLFQMFNLHFLWNSLIPFPHPQQTEINTFLPAAPTLRRFYTAMRSPLSLLHTEKIKLPQLLLMSCPWDLTSWLPFSGHSFFCCQATLLTHIQLIINPNLCSLSVKLVSSLSSTNLYI